MSQPRKQGKRPRDGSKGYYSLLWTRKDGLLFSVRLSTLKALLQDLESGRPGDICSIQFGIPIQEPVRWSLPGLSASLSLGLKPRKPNIPSSAIMPSSPRNISSSPKTFKRKSSSLTISRSGPLPTSEDPCLSSLIRHGLLEPDPQEPGTRPGTGGAATSRSTKAKASFTSRTRSSRKSSA